ncbi:Zinc finger, CCHC-type [Sesbania bispinosa]|nr:Zinc finger, CCHC-type [Sesbania bispinosa]
MPPRTRFPTRKEASGESASQPHALLRRGRGRGRSRGRRGVNIGRHGSTTGVANAEVLLSNNKEINNKILMASRGVRQVDQQPGATTGGIEVTLAEFIKLKPPTFSGSNANEDPQRFIDGLERLWRALGCSDIRVVELASFQLEGETYGRFDTMTRGRLVGSPSLAGGEFSRLFMAHFLPESVRDGLAHEFERLEQTEDMLVSEYSARFTQLSRHAPYPITEEMCVESLALLLKRRQKEKGGSGRDSLKKQRVEGSQSSHPSAGVGSAPGYQSRRSDQGRSSLTTFPQRHIGVTSTSCPTCGRLHVGACFGDNSVCYQCRQAGHIRRDCPAAVMQPSSSQALASSQAPFAPVRQLGGSSGRGSGVAQQSGRGSGGRGQAQAGKGQTRVFAMTRQDAHASNAMVTGILSICSRDAHVLLDPGATHSFVSLTFATQLGKSPSSLDETLVVTTSIEEILLADYVHRSCVVSIGGKELFANPIALDMVDFDVILGMDWESKVGHHII